MEKLLDKFGKYISENLRDNAIENYEKLSQGLWKSPGSKSLQKI